MEHPKNRIVFCLGNLSIQDILIKAIPQYTVAIRMLSLLFAISFNFSRTSKKVVIRSFCCFLFLNFGKIVGLLPVTCIMPEASIGSFRNESRISRKIITKLIFV